MNLSLFELERARKDPKRAAVLKLRKFGGLKPTFPMYWIYAAKLFHKLKAQNDSQAETQAIQYFSQHCQSKLFDNSEFDQKLLTYSRKLQKYFKNYTDLGYPTVQTNKAVQFDDIFGHFISGKIARLDIIPSGGFAATNFEARPSDWRTQLRVPIIQKALANELRCPASEVQVGMYCIESGKHDYITCSDTKISDAVAELQNILTVIEAEKKRLRRDT